MSNEKTAILIVDDEPSVRESLQRWFAEDGYTVETAPDAAQALEKMQGRRWDIALLDVKMPGMDGMELHQRLAQLDPGLTVIFVTAFATVETAVRALKAGAFDYVTKPVDPEHLSHVVQNAVRQRSLQRQNERLQDQISEFARADEIIGDSPQMRQVFEMVQTVARTDTTVMIRGESGTGKELVARAIHGNSARRYFPIVTVNCGAMAEGVLESELFGHEKGAFTGAQYRRKGKIELADGGTLFLDEIGNIDMKTQMDLLRVLETKQFTRVGGNHVIAVDFRVVCATNRDLESAVAAGQFREDLYYRLNVFSVFVPPLRERKGDIPHLANHFVHRIATARGIRDMRIAPEAMDALVRYDWPGNVRELENAVERAMVVGKPPELRAEDLPFQVLGRGSVPSSGSLASMEKAHIGNVLEQNRWNISRSAEVLQIDRATLYHKISKYGLRRP
jgi:DNA-binding NtrC family response regulator